MGRHGEVGGASEVRRVFSFAAGPPKRHHKRLTVVRELEYLLALVIYHPNMPLGIVRADLDLVGAAAAGEQVIVLRPGFEQLPIGIDDQDAVLHLRYAARWRGWDLRRLGHT